MKAGKFKLEKKEYDAETKMNENLRQFTAQRCNVYVFRYSLVKYQFPVEKGRHIQGQPSYHTKGVGWDRAKSMWKPFAENINGCDLF